ncbi:MAG: hypothetical protein H6687_00590 [Bacillales bacterium]|nr:hypothetical protein [Bacillales bacterium]
MKKIIRITSFFVLAVALLALTGCTTPKQAISADYEALVTAYNGKTFSDVVEDLALPTVGENESTIVWSSSDTDIMSDAGVPVLVNGLVNTDGVLSLSDAVRTVTMTGVVSHKGTSVTGTVTFTVTVPAYSEGADLIVKAYSALMTAYEGVQLSGYNYIFSGDSVVPTYEYDFVSYSGVTITYANSTHLSFDGAKATVARPTESATVTDNVSVTLAVGDLSATITVPVIITRDDTNYCTLSDVRDAIDAGSSTYSGKTYAYYGTITEILENTDSYKVFFIQDGEEAFEVYGYNGDTAIQEGDYVFIVSEVTSYNGLYETKSGTIDSVQVVIPAAENTAKINAINTIALTSANFNKTDLAGKDNCVVSIEKLVYIKGTVAISESGAYSSGYITFILDDMATTTTVYVNKYADDIAALATFINSLQVGDIVTISSCTLGWYNAPQLNINLAANIAKSTAVLTNAEKLALEAKYLSFEDSLNSGSETTLDTAGSMFDSIAISWALAEGTDANATIADGKLSIADGGFSFTITATLTLGDATLDKSFEVQAVAPVDLAAVISAVDGSTFEAGTALSATVAYAGEGLCALSDGTHYVVAILPEGVSVDEGNGVIVSLSAASLTSGVYAVVVSAVVVNDGAEGIYGGAFTTVEALAALETVAVQKVVLKNVVIASGAVVSGDFTLSFFDIDDYGTASPAALPDGTYEYLEGFVAPATSTGAVFYATASWTPITTALAAADSTEVNYTLRGVVTIIMSSSGAMLTDEDGNSIYIYKSNLTKIDGFVAGAYVELSGQKGTAHGATRFSVDLDSVLLCASPNAPEVLTNLKANATDLTDVSVLGSAYDYKYVNVTGLTLVVPEGTTYAALTETSSFNVTFKDASNNELSVRIDANAGLEAENAFISLLVTAQANPSAYTFNLTGLWYNYYTQVYPVFDSVALVPVTPVV